MVLLTAFAASGAAFAAMAGYSTLQTNIQTTNTKQEQRIVNETAKFDLYVGKYKFTTRKESEVFFVSKNDDSKNLKLKLGSNQPGEEKTNSGCLLSPKLEDDSIYYSVSNCEVNEKQSPLEKVYFRIENNKTKMNFIYNVRASGDTLEKIK